MDRDIRHEVRTTGKRPRDAFADMIASLPKKFKSSELHDKVVAKIPSFGKVRPQLTRLRTEHYTSNKPYVPDTFNILAAIGGLEARNNKHSGRNAVMFCTGQTDMLYTIQCVLTASCRIFGQLLMPLDCSSPVPKVFCVYGMTPRHCGTSLNFVCQSWTKLVQPTPLCKPRTSVLSLLQHD